MDSKIVLVVGASSGLGRAAAESLAACGHTVYAAARSFADGMQAPNGCQALAVDVMVPESIEAAVQRITDRHGRIDALVCCAATFTMAPLEELPVQTLENMLAVNLIGMTRCVQSVLPFMRKQKNGHIVLFSSLNGLFSIPFQGAYSVTKHAVEAYGQALQQETYSFGIHVTLVEPGDCRGGSQKYRRMHITPGSPYQAFFESGTQKIRHDEENGLLPERVGTAVAKAVSKRYPPARLIVASLDQRSAVWMQKFLPRRLFDAIIIRHYQEHTGERK